MPAENSAIKKSRSTVAVIIHTKDRAEILEHAVASATSQTSAPREIIVVDDGSSEVVDGIQLQARHGSTVRVIRTEQSRGLAYARNQGVNAARAEYIIRLDDDDMLAEDAIEQCLTSMYEHPEVEVLFFSAEGFGPSADYFNRVQPEGVERVIKLGQGKQVRQDFVLFGPALFPALLRTVPIAFQRVFARKVIWEKVSGLLWRVYALDPSICTIESAVAKITGPLRDSEWPRYASLACQHTSLINRPLYLQRCAGQGYSSKPSNREIHSRQQLEMIKHMAHGANSIPELAEWRTPILNAFSQSRLGAAYKYYQTGDPLQAWTHIKVAMLTRVRIKQLCLALRIWLQDRAKMKAR